MRILMLSWEFPPHHRSTLGKACDGLARALAETGFEVMVALPQIYGKEKPGPLRLISLKTGRDMTSFLQANEPEQPDLKKEHPMAKPGFALKEAMRAGLIRDRMKENHHYFGKQHSFGSDNLAAVMRFAERTKVLNKLHFDVIHCHDWLTLPAGLRLKAATGKPLVFHVHSLRSDGTAADNLIDEIERRGLNEADHVVTISHHAKRHMLEGYDIHEDKISVIHNGVSREEGRRIYGVSSEKQKQKTVLFAGPFIFQKGPEYFVDAAAKVIRHYPDVRFVMSGSGEKLDAMLRKVTEWELNEHFQFTGFLDGPDLERVFLEADLYVMPSVDDPFGFSPLEAIVCDTPVIISKQSGVVEILRHALQVDFWDVDRMAEYMLAVLQYEALSKDLVDMAKRELHHLHWRAASDAVAGIYRRWENQ